MLVLGRVTELTHSEAELDGVFGVGKMVKDGNHPSQTLNGARTFTYQFPIESIEMNQI